IGRKVRDSVFGGVFGLSLKFVIFPFFLGLCPSGGYDSNDRLSHRGGDEEHPAVDQANGVEAQLMVGIAIIELDHMWIRRSGNRGRAFFDWHAPWQRPIRSPSLIPAFYILIFSSLFKLTILPMIGSRKLNGCAKLFINPRV